MNKRDALRNNQELVLKIQGLISQTALILSARIDPEIVRIQAVIQSGQYLPKQAVARLNALLKETEWAAQV